jgi:hypothetical protein
MTSEIFVSTYLVSYYKGSAEEATEIQPLLAGMCYIHKLIIL